MARLPGVADISVARADGSRAIGVTDVSGFARGAAALAAGGQALGAGIEKLAAGESSYATDAADYEVSKARANWLSNDQDLKNGLQHDQDYTTLESRYTDGTTKNRDQAAEMISDPARRSLFVDSTNQQIRQSSGVFQQRAFAIEGDHNIAWAKQQGGKFIDLSVATDDPTERARLIQANNDLIDGLVKRGFIRETQALDMKQGWAQQYALADGVARSNSDPQGVLNDLRAAPGSGDAITNRIIQIEGGGKNPMSSSTGDGQFINSTWLDVLKRNRPDIAAGKTDAQLLSLRADKNLAWQMTNAYREENAQALSSQGIEATPGNQYLAHFLGVGGASAVLKANPNEPVESVLTKAFGADKAQAMVRANPSILQGQLAGSVAGWAASKMGGATAGGGQIYDLLSPGMRAQLQQHAQTQLDKQDASQASDLKSRVEDTLAEASRTGSALNPVPVTDFVRTLGASQGQAAYDNYQAQLHLSNDISRLATMSPDQQNELLTSYTPKAGEDGYADQSKRYSQLTKAIVAVRKERDTDPAQFAISRIPSVTDAYQTFSQAVGSPTVDLPTKQAAARDYVNKTIMEQRKAGVPSTDVSILPQGYIDTLKARFDNPTAAGGTGNVVSQLKAEAALWGDNWPTVYRQMAKQVGPVVRVIGSGVPDLPARILTELAPQKLSDILKDQNEEKQAAIKTDVLNAFRPFMGSMAGNEGTISLFNDFRGQGEKLAAYYVTQGMSSSEAATRSYNELIGDRYDFRDGWRAPKGLPQLADDIQAGARRALSTNELQGFNIAPPRDNIGGLSPQYLLKSKFDAIQRDGKWVTAPDESGLALIYKDEAVRRTDGSPVVVPWAQFATIAEQYRNAVSDVRRQQFNANIF